MADRIFQITYNGGLGITLGLGGEGGIEAVGNLAIDLENIPTGTPGTVNYVLASVDGVLKRVLFTGVGSSNGLPYEKPMLAYFSGACVAAYDLEAPDLTLVRRVQGVAGKTNIVRGVTVVGVGGLLGVTGQTQFKIANMPPEDSAEDGYAEATISILAAATYSDRTACTIPLIGDTPYLYWWPVTAGGHSDVMIQADDEISG